MTDVDRYRMLVSCVREPLSSTKTIVTEFIGVWVQLGATVLLLTLFYLLARHAGSSPYFIRWTGAWLAMFAAIVAVALRYLLAPALFPAGEPVPVAVTAPLHGIYLFAKLVHLWLLLSGTWLLARERMLRGRPLVWIGSAAVVALVSAIGSASLRRIMPVQGIVAAVTFSICAFLLLTSRGERKTLGTRFTGSVFVALALLWLAYALLFTSRILFPTELQSLAILFTRVNPFIDAGLEMLLGFGMVLTLLEDAERRAERSRAEHLAAMADGEARRAQALRIEALGRLVSGVAHELNNPLASILTFSEQLISEHPAGDMAGPLATIRDQAHRARAIVRDLLAFVRRRDERWEPADIPVLVERTVRALEAHRQRLGVSLSLELERNLPTLLCAPTAVEQVLTNLLDNAMRAAPGGQVRLVARRDSLGVTFVVSDSGPGIPSGHLTKVFEPFFTTREQGEGTGLGLSVSLGIVEQHRGTLVAKNQDGGKGAIFEVWLPLAAPSPAAAEAVVPVAVSAASRLEGPPGRVLIIDDEASFRASVRRVFERCGWSVREADDGAMALEVLSQTSSDTRFDLILCDLKMPGVSGMEVYRTVRTSRPELLPRLVFASGDTASDETAAFLESTTCPVLEKPFELAELATVVAQIRSRSVTT